MMARWRLGGPSRASLNPVRFIASVWFRIILSLSVLAALLVRFDAREAGRLLTSVDVGYLIAAVAVDLGSRAIMIGRWWLLLREVAGSVSIWTTARVFLVSSFVGAVMPTGGVDLARAYVLSRHAVDSGEAAASVVVDRIVGVVALVALGVVGLTLGASDVNVPYAPLMIGSCFLAMLAIAGMLWADGFARMFVPRLFGFASSGQWLLKAAEAMARYRGRRRILGAVFGLSLVVQLTRIAVISLSGDSLGLGIEFTLYLALMPIGLLVLMLPVSILGIGLPQGAIVWLLRAGGATDAQSFALSSLVVALAAVGTLPGLYFYVRGR